MAITNTPQLSETVPADGRKTLTFATTKPLPTYLIAFAVGPFDMVEWQAIAPNKLRDQPLPLRGFTTRGKGDEMGRFKLGSTVILLFPEGSMSWDEQYVAGTATRLGESLGSR